MHFIAIILGLIILIAPFLTKDLDTYSGLVKGMVRGYFITMGGLAIGWGAFSLYNEYFQSPPPVKTEDYIIEIFNKHNFIKNQNLGEEVIAIKTESLINDCEGVNCIFIWRTNLFKAADSNADKLVSKTELARLIDSFDLDKDGFLSNRKPKIKTLFKSVVRSEYEKLLLACPTGYGKSNRKKEN